MCIRFAVVEVEHSTEPPAPVYWRIMRNNSRVPVDPFVAEALIDWRIQTFQGVREAFRHTCGKARNK
jgi:hypothetical protein